MTALDQHTLMNLARAGAKTRILELENEIAALRAAFPEVGRSEVAGGATPEKPITGRKRGKLSAAGRKAIAAAQRARWAKIKTAKSGPTKPKGMSAAARKAVSKRMRRYWAERRRAKAKVA